MRPLLGFAIVAPLLLTAGCDSPEAGRSAGTNAPAVDPAPSHPAEVTVSSPVVDPPAQDPRTVYVSNLAFNDDSAKIFPSLQNPDEFARDGERIWGYGAVFQQLDACPDPAALSLARDLRRSLAGKLHWSESDYEYTVFIFPNAPTPGSATPEALSEHVFSRMGIHQIFVDQGLLRGMSLDAAGVSEWVEERLVQPPPPDEDPSDYMPAKPELAEMDKDLQSSLSNFVYLDVDLASRQWITAIHSDLMGGYVGNSNTLVFVMSTGIYT